MRTTTKLQTSLWGQLTENFSPMSQKVHVSSSVGHAQWSARIGIKGDIVDAIGALHSNGIRPASARADMPQTALPSPTELQDGEGGCEPRAPPRAESGGGGCKCCLEAADGPHWLGARRRPLRGEADAADAADVGAKEH